MSQFNRTTIYLLPLITNMYDESLKAYLGINKFNDIDGIIYIVCDNEEIMKQMQKECRFKGIAYIDKLKVYLFQIDDKYTRDYELFILGNYSEMKYKNKIINYWKKYDRNYYNLTFNVFKDPEYLKLIYINNLTSRRENFVNISDTEIISEILDSVNEVESIFNIKEEILT